MKGDVSLRELCEPELADSFYAPLGVFRVSHTKGLGCQPPESTFSLWKEDAERPQPGACSERTGHHLLATQQRRGGSLLKVILAGRGSLGTWCDSVPCAPVAVPEGLMGLQGNGRPQGLAGCLPLPFPNPQDTLQPIKLSPPSPPSPLLPGLVPRGQAVLTLHTSSQEADSSK